MRASKRDSNCLSDRLGQYANQYKLNKSNHLYSKSGSFNMHRDNKESVNQTPTPKLDSKYSMVNSKSTPQSNSNLHLDQFDEKRLSKVSEEHQVNYANHNDRILSQFGTSKAKQINIYSKKCRSNSRDQFKFNDLQNHRFNISTQAFKKPLLSESERPQLQASKTMTKKKRPMKQIQLFQQDEENSEESDQNLEAKADDIRKQFEQSQLFATMNNKSLKNDAISKDSSPLIDLSDQKQSKISKNVNALQALAQQNMQFANPYTNFRQIKQSNRFVESHCITPTYQLQDLHERTSGQSFRSQNIAKIDDLPNTLDQVYRELHNSNQDTLNNTQEDKTQWNDQKMVVTDYQNMLFKNTQETPQKKQSFAIKIDDLMDNTFKQNKLEQLIQIKNDEVEQDVPEEKSNIDIQEVESKSKPTLENIEIIDKTENDFQPKLLNIQPRVSIVEENQAVEEAQSDAYNFIKNQGFFGEQTTQSEDQSKSEIVNAKQTVNHRATQDQQIEYAYRPAIRRQKSLRNFSSNPKQHYAKSQVKRTMPSGLRSKKNSTVAFHTIDQELEEKDKLQEMLDEMSNQIKQNVQAKKNITQIERSIQLMKQENQQLRRENVKLVDKNGQLEKKVFKVEKELGSVRQSQHSTDKDTLVLNEKIIQLEIKLEKSINIQKQQSEQLLKHQNLLKNAQKKIKELLELNEKLESGL